MHEAPDAGNASSKQLPASSAPPAHSSTQAAAAQPCHPIVASVTLQGRSTSCSVEHRGTKDTSVEHRGNKQKLRGEQQNYVEGFALIKWRGCTTSKSLEA